MKLQNSPNLGNDRYSKVCNSLPYHDLNIPFIHGFKRTDRDAAVSFLRIEIPPSFPFTFSQLALHLVTSLTHSLFSPFAPLRLSVMAVFRFRFARHAESPQFYAFPSFLATLLLAPHLLLSPYSLHSIFVHLLLCISVLSRCIFLQLYVRSRFSRHV